jgi:glucans biosynthesis protein
VKRRPGAPNWRAHLALAAAAPRCRARRKHGQGACLAPAVTGRTVCRMHGGSAGSGGPCGEHNGRWRHGLRSAEYIAERRAVRAHLLAFFRLIEAAE